MTLLQMRRTRIRWTYGREQIVIFGWGRVRVFCSMSGESSRRPLRQSIFPIYTPLQIDHPEINGHCVESVDHASAMNMFLRSGCVFSAMVDPRPRILAWKVEAIASHRDVQMPSTLDTQRVGGVGLTLRQPAAKSIGRPMGRLTDSISDRRQFIDHIPSSCAGTLCVVLAIGSHCRWMDAVSSMKLMR